MSKLKEALALLRGDCKSDEDLLELEHWLSDMSDAVLDVVMAFPPSQEYINKPTGLTCRIYCYDEEVSGAVTLKILTGFGTLFGPRVVFGVPPSDLSPATTAECPNPRRSAFPKQHWWCCEECGTVVRSAVRGAQ